ncbi:MAG: transcriptional repressor [Deltaproteobacteria bacterium]|nr:transcriptional repressor [Deltaproteobacteria bacterium]
MDANKEKIERLLTEAKNFCVLNGTKFTKLRRLILETLILSSGPLKAYDLIESLREKGFRLSPSTVYRILEFFIQNGLVHRVDTLNAFVACSDAPSHRHNPLFLVCPDCQETNEINDESLYTTIFNRLGALGFPVEGGSVEVRGLCNKCANKKK